MAGIFVVAWRKCLCWWVSNWDIRSIVVFYVNGTTEQRLCITWRGTGLRGISEGRIEECTTPSTGSMAQNPATAPTHQTRSDEKLRKSHGLDRIGVQVSGRKIPSTQRSEKLRGVFVGPQICKLFRRGIFNNLLQGDEEKAWDAFFWCQLPSSGILGQKTTRNWLRTRHCITNLVAMYP